jgi:hypothetical protein
MSLFPNTGNQVGPVLDEGAMSGIPRSGSAPVEADAAIIDLYKPPGIPRFVEKQVDLVHGHLYSSLSFYRIQKQLGDAHAYVANRHGKQVAIFVFRVEQDRVIVLNEFIKPACEEVFRFAGHVFSTFDSVRIVTFPALTVQIQAPPYPCQYVIRSEDMILELPGSIAEYDQQLGKNMRRNMKRYLQSLKKDFPSFEYTILHQDAIPEAAIRAIIDLSCERMRRKNIEPRFTEEEVKWIVDYAQRCGMVGLITIDNRICAGAISFRIGDNFFMHVIAHDPRFNNYSMGIVCYYLTICKGIENGVKTFHLLEGRYGYKQRLLAKRRDIAELDIYRSRTIYLLNAAAIGKKRVGELMRSSKQWLLHDAELSDKTWARSISRIVQKLRSLKRSGYAL